MKNKIKHSEKNKYEKQYLRYILKKWEEKSLRTL